LIIATLSALAALPRLTKAAGLGLFTVDLAAQLWDGRAAVHCPRDLYARWTGARCWAHSS